MSRTRSVSSPVLPRLIAILGVGTLAIACEPYRPQPIPEQRKQLPTPDLIDTSDPDPTPRPVGTTRQACAPHDAPIKAEGVDLPIPLALQQCTYWCWAGALTMVSNYYGRAAMECEFAMAKTGFPCCNYAACAYPQCNTIGFGTDIANLLMRVGVHGVALQRALTETELRTELSNGRPVIVNYYNSFSGHYAVLTGFRPYNGATIYHVKDPWPDFGDFWNTYPVIRNGPSGNTPWSYTFTRLSTRTDGCNTRYNPGCGCP